MSIRAATPYLILDGRAEQAIALYARAFGAETETLQRFGEVDASCPGARRELVIHASLRLGSALLMLSDGPEVGAPPRGGAVSVALDFDDEAALRRSYDALAATGKPVAPVFEAPWGALFGVVEDELGISWMLNFTRAAH